MKIIRSLFGLDQGDTPTFDDVSGQPETRTQKQRNNNHLTTILWVKITQRYCSKGFKK